MIPAIVVSVDKALNEHRTVESENPERFWQLCHEIAVMADYKDLKIIVELLDFLSGFWLIFPQLSEVLNQHNYAQKHYHSQRQVI